jgi:subtilisin family serine protease
MVEGRLQHHLDRVAKTSALATSSITIILEADSISDNDVSPHGGALRYHHDRLHEVTIPNGKLAALLASLPSNVVARLPYHHEPVAVVGQGVAKTGAGDMQAMGNSGAGVKMGIIDLGFVSLDSAIASGDLPSNMVTTDYTGIGLQTEYDHGTNVAEIAHQMAPGATLYLAKIATETQLSQALTDMAAAGVKVINHSVAWFGAAFYDGTGPICNIANSASGLGILWMNAMGNSRAAHYLGTFTDANADLRHEFAPGQNYNTISLTANSPVSLILNWNAYPTTTTDYNLYLFSGNPDSGGVLVASSTARQSGTISSQPLEQINYTPTISGTYYIVVKKAKSSTPNLRFTLFSTGPELGIFTAASSILQPADCVNVVGVGAVNLSESAEWFSSEGPTTDGRAKPEISAPDGTQTSLSSAFYGTSGSSPHATGAATLLLAKNLSMTPVQLRAALVAAVKDVGATGYDYRTGSGRISLDADGDGLNHDEELFYGTSPIKADTDGDGLSDMEEVKIYDTSPLRADTDGDGISDFDEVMVYHTNPNISNKGDIAPRGAPDGKVDIADLLILSRFVEGLDVPTARENALADINGDGVLDVRDILLLRRQLGF